MESLPFVMGTMRLSLVLFVIGSVLVVPKLDHLGTEHDVACHRWQELADEPEVNNITK